MEEKVYTINLNKVKTLTTRYCAMLDSLKADDVTCTDSYADPIAEMSSKELREFAKDLRRG